MTFHLNHCCCILLVLETEHNTTTQDNTSAVDNSMAKTLVTWGEVPSCCLCDRWGRRDNGNFAVT